MLEVGHLPGVLLFTTTALKSESWEFGGWAALFALLEFEIERHRF